MQAISHSKGATPLHAAISLEAECKIIKSIVVAIAKVRKWRDSEVSECAPQRPVIKVHRTSEAGVQNVENDPEQTSSRIAM